jgi:hypothetical protein
VLAIINDSNNYGVVINVPFELKKHFVKPVAVYLLARWNIYCCKSETICSSCRCYFSNAKYILKMNATEVLPENLIVSVRIPKSNKSSIITLPKAAILK